MLTVGASAWPQSPSPCLPWDGGGGEGRTVGGVGQLPLPSTAKVLNKALESAVSSDSWESVWPYVLCTSPSGTCVGPGHWTAKSHHPTFGHCLASLRKELLREQCVTDVE